MKAETRRNRILLVDDDLDIRCGVANVLIQNMPGYLIDEMGCAEGAIGMVKTHIGQYALVLTDNKMEYGNAGLDSIARMRRLDPDVPIVLMSGSINGIKDKAITDGANAVLSKPIDKAVFIEELKKYLVVEEK